MAQASGSGDPGDMACSHRVTSPVVLVLVFILVGSTARSREVERDLDRETYRVAHDLMSPFCPGRTLADCPSPYAREIRLQIREALGSGVSAPEVAAGVAAALGDEVRGRPKSVWGWATPPLATLGGIAVALFLIRRLGRQEAGSGAPRPAREREPLDVVLDAELEALDS